METWDAVRARRNVRAYADVALPDQHLESILEAAWRTPSSMNEQPWDFVVCTQRETLRGLAETWKYSDHVANSAATVVLVAETTTDQDTRDWIFYDMGQATMSMMLVAADLGIGSSHAGVDDQPRVRELLGLPPDRFCVGLLALGIPADRPLRPITKPDRRPFDRVIHRERW
ncbi:MAG: nitroreductase family protein [Actinomycetota bacterium]